MSVLYHPNESFEELHKRIDALLAERTKCSPTCIVCRNLIADDSDLVDTIHGPYHSWCLDGHP